MAKLSKQWITKTKKDWKKLLSDVQRATDVQGVKRSLSLLHHFTTRLQEDMLINKGFWYVLGPWSGNRNLKARGKVTKLLREITSEVGVAQYIASKRLNVSNFDMKKDFILETLDEADRIFSRSLIPFLKREEKKGIDLDEFLPSKINVKGLSLMFEDHAERNPVHRMEMGDPVVTPKIREGIFTSVGKAHSALQRKGLGHLWYGDIVVTEEISHNAIYATNEDRVYLNPYAPQDRITYLLVHEMGHRHWFKFMSPHDRQAFSAYFETGEVEPVTDYGGTMSEEDFAEVFAYYVMGMPLSMDQKERFQQFFGQRISSGECPIVDRVVQRFAASKGL